MKLYNDNFDNPKITNIIATRRLSIALSVIMKRLPITSYSGNQNENENKDAVHCSDVRYFVDILKEDTDLEEIDEIRNVMMMGDVWKKIVL